MRLQGVWRCRLLRAWSKSRRRLHPRSSSLSRDIWRSSLLSWSRICRSDIRRRTCDGIGRHRRLSLPIVSPSREVGSPLGARVPTPLFVATRVFRRDVLIPPLEQLSFRADRWSSARCIVQLVDRAEMLTRTLGDPAGAVHFYCVNVFLAGFNYGAASAPPQGGVPVAILDEDPLAYSEGALGLGLPVRILSIGVESNSVGELPLRPCLAPFRADASVTILVQR